MRMRATTGRVVGALALLLSLGAAAPSRQAAFDIVISGGRVMDPETGFDRIANVGIRGHSIVAISTTPLHGQVEIDARGNVVAPGFIDLHAHGQMQLAQRYQAHDGVTTAIDAEAGALPLAPYYQAMAGRSIINYGVSASHRCARIEVIGGVPCGGHFATNEATYRVWTHAGAAGDRPFTQPATPEQQARIVALLRQAVDEGAIGVGLGLEYTPGAGRSEIYDIFKMAADINAPVFVHVRRRTPDAAPGVPIAVVQELIADAAVTGASLHICHVHSTGLGDTPVLIDMIDRAEARGIDVTSEAYPYTAGSTMIGSEFFAPGWQQRSSITYSDLQWTATGERLTEESFNRYRRETPNGMVIVHMIPDAIVDQAIAASNLLISSDGQPWMTQGEHPRGAGTFSRVLGRYVRERHTLTLMAALRKMTLLPAQRLEQIAPAMHNKGRIRVGADADIVIFDPNRIIDNATYEHPMQFSGGISTLIVGGTPVIRNGELVANVFPGQAVRSQPTAARRPATNRPARRNTA